MRRYDERLTPGANALLQAQAVVEASHQWDGLDWEDFSGRGDPRQRFRIYRLCDCAACNGAREIDGARCLECRGEGRVRELLATAATAEAVGVALVTLGREGEFEECPVGVLDIEGEVGQKWILKPWLPSPRNVSDAGRVLGSARERRGT